MRVGIMQPYFFPYLGYFSLIKHTDKFILLDKVQFIRHGWIERNRILKQSGGWNYISVPLQKHHRNILISDITINNEENWKQRIISQLGYYKGAANYYKIVKLVKYIFEHEFQSIVELNYYAMRIVCEYLKINTPIDIFSEMNLQINPPLASDEWALNICTSIQEATEYWNPINGIHFFDRQKYFIKDIDIHFQRMNITRYEQKNYEFEPWLSILDVMMFNSVEDINIMLDNYELF